MSRKRIPAQNKIVYYDHAEHLESLSREAVDTDGELRLPPAGDWADNPQAAQTRGILRDVWLSEKDHGIKDVGPVCVQFEHTVETLDGGGFGEPEWRLRKMHTTVAKIPRKKQMVKIKGPVASPAVVELATKLGVDLTQVKPTGRNARVTESDVSKFAKKAGEAA